MFIIFYDKIVLPCRDALGGGRIGCIKLICKCACWKEVWPAVNEKSNSFIGTNGKCINTLCEGLLHPVPDTEIIIIRSAQISRMDCEATGIIGNIKIKFVSNGVVT